MIRYGKSTQNAIAAMSRLAEAYPQGERLSSHDIAKSRGIAQTLVAKLLTQLSQAGLVSGMPGPNGGYALAKEPGKITLLDITSVFERTDDRVNCPFGPGWCGNNEPCPIHDQLMELDKQVESFLETTTLERFEKPRPQDG